MFYLYLSLSLLTFMDIYCCYFEKKEKKESIIFTSGRKREKKVRIMGKLNEL